jgi:lysozyme
MDWLQLALPRSRRYEQLRLVAYLCPAGVWTVGYGATGPGIGPGTTWTEEQSETNLRDRFVKLGARIEALVLVHLKPHQMAALALLADNIGINAFRASTLLRKLDAGDYTGAAKEFDKWTRGGGRVLPGLVKRRADERALFEGRS